VVYTVVGVVLMAAVVLAPVLYIVTLVRGRDRFDATVSPPDDLRRADDGYRPTLGERDGTGGLV
jgi:hypothetical protein